MIAEETKRRVVGLVEDVIGKLKTHAEMAKHRPVNEASLRLLPSVQQCDMLAERLGAALGELECAWDELKTAFASAPGSGALTWSAEKPKRCGRWWVVAKGHPAQIRHFTDTPLTELRDGEYPYQPNDGALSTEGWEWFAGPLPEPPPAPDAEPPLND